MSKVQNFVTDARTPNTGVAPYYVNPPASRKAQSYWPPRSVTNSPNTFEPARTTQVTVQQLPVQVKSAFTNHYRFIGQIPSRKSLERQVKQVSGYYQELKKLGFDIQDVTTFGLKHAKALLSKWQVNECAPNTLYARWSGLRTWSRVLGKHGMLGKITDVQPEFNRSLKPVNGNQVLSLEQVKTRSEFLKTKADATVYLVDQLCRVIGLTREEALQVELDELNAVVNGGAMVFHVGLGNNRKNVPASGAYLALFTQIRDFIVSRNRKTLAWSDLDLDASLQKYALRLSYVTRTLFPETKRGTTAAKKESNAA